MMFGIIEEMLGRERWFPALLTGTFVTRVSAKTRKHATLFMPDVPRNLCRIRRVSSEEPSSQETNFEASIEGSPIPAPFGFSAAWAGSRIGDCHIPALLFVMLEIAITLIRGFALGYGVREWAFRQSHRAGQRRRRPF
jgi:hypothetical protein